VGSTANEVVVRDSGEPRLFFEFQAKSTATRIYFELIGHRKRLLAETSWLRVLTLVNGRLDVAAGDCDSKSAVNVRLN